MMIHVPGMGGGSISLSYSEHVDLYPTLAEAAAGVIIPKCPAGEAMLSTALCTMGNSLVPILHDPKAVVAAASFSQYPRGYQRPDGVVEAEGGTDSGSPSTSQCILTHCTMGYTMVTTLGGKEYRYTEWVDYGTKEKFTPDWGRNVGTELYDHAADPGENVNQAGKAAYAQLQAKLSKQLQAGPLTGGGWGPWAG